MQQERMVGVLRKPLVHFVLFLFCFLLPGTTEARVYAYIDAKGEFYHVPPKGSALYQLGRKSGKGFKTSGVVGKSAAPLKLDMALKDDNSAARMLSEFIQAAATKHEVDPLLIKAIIKAESNFDHRAVSAKGAQGLMQLMPATAKELQVVDPFDPLENIVGGTKYLRYLLDSYDGDVALSLAAYNAGPGNVKSSIPNIPETRTYVSKVLGNYQFYRSNK